jgi:hypothetical protein
MKTDRFVILLAGFLLAASLPAAGKGFSVGPVKVSFDSSSKRLAKAIAARVGQVEMNLDANRRALSTVPGADGKPAYLRKEITGLITRTADDLDKAIEAAQPSGTEPLRAWAAEEVARIQGNLARPAGPVASISNPFAPRAIAVVASLREFGLPMLAKSKPAPPKAAPPKPDAVDTGTANRLLDQLEATVHQIFVLAHDDKLEVKLWVGSTPVQKVRFSFWPQGNFKGSRPDLKVIQTNGKESHILRGLYSYQAALGAGKKGSVVTLIEYPSPAGAPVAQMSQRLDLVKGSSFFCCQFGENYCHHVDDEKDCH